MAGIGSSLERIGTGKLVVIGIFGMLWLFMVMLIVVGATSIITVRSWLPKVMERRMGLPAEGADLCGEAEEVEEPERGC